VLRNSVIRAEGIWRGYKQEGHFCWVLQGLDVDILEGESVAVLGEPGSGKSTLLKVLGFREKPDQGRVFFQDRLPGWDSEEVVVQMQNKRVWLLNNYNEKSLLDIGDRESVGAILLDEPEILFEPKGECTWSGQLHSLNTKGIAVIVATSEPEMASRAGVIYKLKNGKLEKLTGKIRG